MTSSYYHKIRPIQYSPVMFSNELKHKIFCIFHSFFGQCKYWIRNKKGSLRCGANNGTFKCETHIL